MKAKRNQLFATIGLVVLAAVVALAGLLLAVLPQRSQTHDLDAQVAAAQAKLVSLQRNRHNGPTIRAAQLFQLARAMPDDTDMPGIVVNLARASAAAHVTILSVTPAASVAQTDGAMGTPLQLSVVGSWNGIAAFLRTLRTEVRVRGDKLTAAGRLFTVDSVQLASSAPAPSSSGGTSTTQAQAPSGELNATLRVNAFTYGVALPPPSTDTTGTTTTTSPPGSAVAAGAGSSG